MLVAFIVVRHRHAAAAIHPATMPPARRVTLAGSPRSIARAFRKIG
jgi:hypothetical protein